jgi:hypothetical protein
LNCADRGGGPVASLSKLHGCHLTRGDFNPPIQMVSRRARGEVLELTELSVRTVFRHQESLSTPPSGHPPHVERPDAAPESADRSRPPRWRRGLGGVAAVAVGAVLVLGAAGCYAPASSGPSPDVQNAINGAFGDAGPSVVACMTNIAGRESGFDPGARNSSGASGLFQLMLPLHNDLFYALGVDPGNWPNPVWNARAARELWNSSGIAPWGHC